MLVHAVPVDLRHDDLFAIEAAFRDDLAAGCDNEALAPELDPFAAGRMLHSVLFIHGVWAAKRARIPFMRDLSDNQVLDQLVDFCLHAIDQAPAPTASHVHT